MDGEISLEKSIEKIIPEEEKGLLGNLEEKIDHLLVKYQDLKKEREYIGYVSRYRARENHQVGKKVGPHLSG